MQRGFVITLAASANNARDRAASSVMSANAAGARSSRSCAREATAEMTIAPISAAAKTVVRKRIGINPSLRPALRFNLNSVGKLHFQHAAELAGQAGIEPL